MTPKTGTEVEIARALVGWYRACRRDLPWRRRAGDAYAIWVSEIMLQQTTVAAVIPYFERWMARFPTIRDLAQAPVGDVLALWAGLGYYARARNLHAAAQTVVDGYAGRVPDTVADLVKLPGVGDYTAGAIASIAYGAPVPLVDANVARVLSRLHGLTDDPRGTSGRKRLWRHAEVLIPPGDAGDFNQGLMELGATLCSPAAPSCESCPLAAWCVAKASGNAEAYPSPSAGKQWRSIDDVAVVVECSGRILLVRRPLTEKLWGGLWEAPRLTRSAGETIAGTAARALEERGVRVVSSPVLFGSLRHVVANRKITLHGYRVGVEQSVPADAEHAWVDPAALSDYAMATPQRRLLALWARQRLQPSLELTV